MTRLGIADYEAVLAFLAEAHALDEPAHPATRPRRPIELLERSALGSALVR